MWGLLLASVLAFGLFILQEKRAGESAVVDLKNLRSKHRSAIMASGFLLSIVNGAVVSPLLSIWKLGEVLMTDVLHVRYTDRSQLRANDRPVYFTVVVNTSTSRAGMINSICGGLGLATGSLLAGQ